MSLSIFYVYKYINEAGQPYYIGKGSKNRINETHLPWTVLPPKDRRIIIRDNMSEHDAYEFEVELIKLYGRKIDGGLLDNTKLNRWSCKSGWHHSEETKKQISKKNKGRTYSQETLEKYRVPKSKEHAEKIRQANLGRKRDNRYEKIGKTMSLKKWYNNGNITKMFVPGTELLGFVPGRKIEVM